MKKLSALYHTMGIGAKLAVFSVFVIIVLFTSYTFSLASSTRQLISAQNKEKINQTTQSVYDLLEIFDGTVGQQVNRYGELFFKSFTEKFSIDEKNIVPIKDKQLPALMLGNEIVSGNFKLPDDYTANTGVIATFFLKQGDEFIRVSTSLKNDKDERAFGTILVHTSPAYSQLMSGQKYTGMAELFGKYYATNYTPIKDDKGSIIGALFVGLNVHSQVDVLKKSIENIKVGDHGYVFIANSAKGSPAFGNVLVHSDKEGTNNTKSEDAKIKDFANALFEKSEGELIFKSDKADEERIVLFRNNKKWNWMIGSVAYSNEINKKVNEVYNLYTILGIVALLVLCVLLYWVIRRLISNPLSQLTELTHKIAQGDLTVQSQSSRRDEIGMLYSSINEISQNLSSIVSNVRSNSEQINFAANQIESGNLELSARSEEQAASIEETASTMEQLSVTMKDNAKQVDSVSALIENTTKIAQEGGQSMHQLIDTMKDIHHSSHKITEIISVIDSIAFQTNILALNAAVEAARAGEQGRGFAVVASEVRELAHKSAAAAKEIKGLIENSAQNVNAGNKLVSSTGNNIQSIIESISNINGIMKSIAISNQEQSLGIDQINQAMSQIDDNTQQNAALVEEASTAATSMKHMTEELNQKVHVFKI